MMKTGNGKISIGELGSINLNGKNTKYNLDMDNHYLELEFNERIWNEKENITMVKVIELEIEENVFCTYYNCLTVAISKQKCRLFFQIALEGKFVDDIDAIRCSKIEYTVRNSPIPLVALTLLPEMSVIESANVIVGCRDIDNDIAITIETKNNLMSVDELETVFFNIMDITFLVNGYYPYIAKEVIVNGQTEFEIFRLYKSIYAKGKSNSHWNKSIACPRDLVLNEIYNKYLNIIKKNKLTVSVLSNVIHSDDIYADLILCNLLQCIEGYMKKFHKQEKFSKDIVADIKEQVQQVILSYDLPENAGTTNELMNKSAMGLIGNINRPDFVECLHAAINMNENTKEIFIKEIESNSLEGYLKKSKNVRNQFSHMIPFNDTFEDGEEIKQAIDKYSILLRIIVLTDLGVDIRRSSIKNYVDKIVG